MLIDVEGYGKPASRESRLVMIQLEPKAEKGTQMEQETKHKMGREDKKKDEAIAQGLFQSVSWKHVAVGKGFMAAHAHDIRLEVRRKMSDVIWKKNTEFLAFSPMMTIFMK
jgi:hypothetical protein